MSVLTPLQASFSAGEITPLMQSRSDLEGYKNGLSELLNMHPDPRGPAYSRTGNKHIGRVTGTDARTETLQISDTEYYNLLFTDLKLDVSTRASTAAGDILSVSTPYTSAEVSELQFIDSPQSGIKFILHKNHPIYQLGFVASLWSLAIYAITAPPAAWVAGSYPVTGTIFEGRLWVGGPSETFWGSKSAVYNDFTMGTAADDAMTRTMAKQGAIRWIEGLKNLLVGTENGEHIITSAGGVIKPGDIQADQQSSYGSAAIEPKQVGDQIFYVSPDRRKLRSMQFEWTANNWLSKDLTFTSEHITAGLIKNIVWAQNPDNLLLAVMQNGDVAALKYERSNSIYGWSLLQYETSILDMTTGVMNGVNEVTSATTVLATTVDVEIAGTGERVFMDSWKSVTSGTPITTFAGFSYLEGMEVQVLTDGAVHPNRTVSGGEIDLQWPAEVVIVGLAFTSRMRTLPFDNGSQTGSGASHKKRYHRTFVRLLSSAKPKINGRRAPERHASTPMNEGEPGRSEDVEVAQLGYSNDEEIAVEQDLPLDLVVAAIFGRLTQSRV